MKVTIADLERLTGKTFRTIKRRLQQLQPTSQRGNKVYYQASSALPMIYQEDKSDTLLLNHERARLAAAQADKTELEFQKLSGKLVDLEEIRFEMSKRILGTRAKLLALPRKMAMQVTAMSSPQEVEQTLESIIYQALTELADTAGTMESQEVVNRIFDDIRKKINPDTDLQIKLEEIRLAWHQSFERPESIQ